MHSSKNFALKAGIKIENFISSCILSLDRVVLVALGRDSFCFVLLAL